MRKQADWMVETDERIMELLDGAGSYQPSQLAAELADVGVDMDFHPKYVGRRCRALADHGLLENMGNGVYEITDIGSQFLAGEFDAGTIE